MGFGFCAESFSGVEHFLFTFFANTSCVSVQQPTGLDEPCLKSANRTAGLPWFYECLVALDRGVISSCMKTHRKWDGFNQCWPAAAASSVAGFFGDCQHGEDVIAIDSNRWDAKC